MKRELYIPSGVNSGAQARARILLPCVTETAGRALGQETALKGDMHHLCCVGAEKT